MGAGTETNLPLDSGVDRAGVDMQNSLGVSANAVQYGSDKPFALHGS